MKRQLLVRQAADTAGIGAMNERRQPIFGSFGNFSNVH
jgi:hypothetical protein